VNPIIHRNLMQAKVADLHLQAERDRVGRVPRRNTHARRRHGRPFAPIHIGFVPGRRTLGVLRARNGSAAGSAGRQQEPMTPAR
jgi:hypothetical protein